MINQEAIACRYRIRLYRAEKQYSLTMLSKRLNLSISTLRRIEKGETAVPPHVLEHMQILLGLKKESEEYKNAIENHFKTIIKALYFADYAKAKRLFERHFSDEEGFLKSSFFLDYYLLKTTYLMLSRNDIKHFEDDLLKMRLVEDYYLDKYKDLYYLMNARYEMMKYHLDCAKRYFEKHRAVSINENYLAMNYYYQGILLGFSYRTYQEALRRFTHAKQLFQAQNNFIRVVETKIIQQRLLIYVNNYPGFHRLNEETLHYAEIHDNTLIYNYSLHTKALYYIATKAYQEALDLMNQYHINTIEYYFRKVVVLFYLGHYQEAKQMMEVKSTQVQDASLAAILSGYKTFSSLIDGLPKTRIETHLKDFADKAYASEAYFLIKVAFKLIIQFLEKERKYKAAYSYSKKLLDVTTKMVRWTNEDLS